jgi:hypothetical protein
MSIKVAVTTSLLVGLTASVAHAQESSATKEECPTPDQFKAAGATGPTSIDADFYEALDCPPGESVQPVQRVSAPLTPAAAPVGLQTDVYTDEPIESHLDLAPKNAFEIGFQAGYAQPFGDLVGGVNVSDLTDAGGEIGVDVGWRINPMAAIAFTGRYWESSVDDDFADSEVMDIRGGAVGLQGAVHLMPYGLVDPYITMGAGYRAMVVIPRGPGDTAFHGVEVGRVQVGADFRVARDFSIGPNAGAALNVFFAEDGDAVETTIDDPGPSAFVFAGIAGRFQLGGTRQSAGVYYGKYDLTREYTASR